MNGISEFLKKNAWQIVTFIASIIVAWTVLTMRIDNMELKVKEIEAKQSEIVEINERLVRLETKIDILLNNNK